MSVIESDNESIDISLSSNGSRRKRAVSKEDYDDSEIDDELEDPDMEEEPEDQSEEEEDSSEEDEEEPNREKKREIKKMDIDKDDDGEEEEEDDDEVEDEEDMDEDDDDDERPRVSKKRSAPVSLETSAYNVTLDSDDEEVDDSEDYLQKFDAELNKNYIMEFHPECLNHNSEEVAMMATVIRDATGAIVDPLHRTLPFLTKYEKARVLGQRAKQIEVGALPYVEVPETIVDGYLIAEMELREKKLPFIIKRPIPGGAFEYWHVCDLENINF